MGKIIGTTPVSYSKVTLFVKSTTTSQAIGELIAEEVAKRGVEYVVDYVDSTAEEFETEVNA